MKFAWVLFLSTALAAAPEATPTPTAATPPTNEATQSSVGQALKSLPFQIPTETNAHMANISPPPASLINQVITAVPPSALIQIMNPTKRRSLADQIRSGNTPDWYSSLPTDVRNYMGTIRSQVHQGALTQPVSTSTSSTGSATGSEAGTGTGSGASETNAASGGKDRMMGIGLLEVVAMGIAMML